MQRIMWLILSLLLIACASLIVLAVKIAETEIEIRTAERLQGQCAELAEAVGRMADEGERFTTLYRQSWTTLTGAAADGP